MNIFILLLLSCQSGQIRKHDTIASSNEILQTTTVQFNDLIGSWADKRIVNNINEVNREKVFRPASGFWFSRDLQTSKPFLNVQYSEHDYEYQFDSVIFQKVVAKDYDSCFSINDNKKSFLLLYHKQDATISDLQLIDSSIFSKHFQQSPKTYYRVAPSPVKDIEQYSMGKFLIDSLIVVEVAGRKYQMSRHYNFNKNVFYEIKGLPSYSVIQFIDWEVKDKKRIEVALAGKGHFDDVFLLSQEGANNYMLVKQERKTK